MEHNPKPSLSRTFRHFHSGAARVESMDPLASAVGKVKGFFKSREDRVKAESQTLPEDSLRNDPIKILKRLQREAFSDIMKLRERQDKLERALSLYKSEKESQNKVAKTRMKGVIDSLCALFFADTNKEEVSESLRNAGVSTGIESKFIFETLVRQNDALITEFFSGNKNLNQQSNSFSNPLVLAKVSYSININDWLSVITSPLGAQCKDFGLGSHSMQGISGISSIAPPLFSKYHCYAAGLNIKASNFFASLAELVSESNSHTDSTKSSLTTFGQFGCQPFEGTKLTLSGLWELPGSPFRQIKIGSLAMPLFGPKRRDHDTFAPSPSSSIMFKPKDVVSYGSLALMLESEFDENTRLGAWVQLQKTSPNYLQWSVSLSDAPENDVGWGLTASGSIKGHVSQVQFGGFLQFNVGKSMCLQPGIMYAVSGGNQKPIMMLRSSCFF